MVDIHGAVLADSGGIDSTLVVSESINNLECNGDWTVGVKGLGEGNLITLSDVYGSSDNVQSVGRWLDRAWIILGGVWVSSLSADTMRLNTNVLESVGWESAFATMVVEVLCTVNELLLREWSERFVLKKFVSFESTNSGESPAGTAASLILNWGNTIMILPVPRIWNINLTLVLNWTLGGRAVLLFSNGVLVHFVVVHELLLSQV